ncbi:hypothetical protein CAGA_24300 [Caproiciproducens galactitolivorans]|uniref:Uncharacterized protein n=2 Tax=Caproiciproducens galactitolivorans TaxID=642589 RepID=A0A4Z0YC38_9FIRM|nr:hypothetical protein CAGA_24300 [Caproiciproducens galactitolivorans]
MRMKGMIGMSEMTLQECIVRLEDLIQDRKSFFSKDGNDDVFRTDAAALEKAVSMLHKIAAGEYKRVAHGRWVNMPFNVDNDKYGMNKYNMRIKCTNCGFVTSSELKYAHCPVCGALMDGKDEAE